MAYTVNEIMKYESGEMNDKESIQFFSKLIKSGDCWRLQGSYGRAANALIEQEIIDRQGNILVDLDEFE